MPEALGFSRKVLRALKVLTWMYGGAILALLIASFLEPEWFFRAIGVKAGDTATRIPGGMQMIAALGILTIPLYVAILDRLIAMVDTVRARDPFVLANADRLHRIAWSVVGLELLHLAIGAIMTFTGLRNPPYHMDWSFSIAPWIAVLLLFVLAKVFEHGARMRDDLEGTV
jgi:hypothetical protein